jgi:hypothetical protein
MPAYAARATGSRKEDPGSRPPDGVTGASLQVGETHTFDNEPSARVSAKQRKHPGRRQASRGGSLFGF